MTRIAPANRYTLHPSFGDFYFDPRMALSRGYSGANVRVGPRHWTRGSAAGFWSRADLDAALGRPDVVHANNFWCPTTLRTSRLVYTCYDLGFLVEPAWTTEANRVGCFQGMFRSAIHADWIVAISESTRAHYLETFPHFPADRIRVIHPCSRFDPAALRARRPSRAAPLEPGRYWLSVGTIEPRKNQRRLAQAYARYLALGGAAMPLVLAGGSGWLMEDFAATLRDLGVDPHVLRLGYVDDAELAWLYRNCFANLYPSLFEGFGLPVLEGMQFGAPTIASNASSIPEVAGEAAILVAPEDVEAWAQAMLRLANDTGMRAALGARAGARASAFDWRVSAQRLLDLYGEAMRSPKREALAA